MFTVAAETLAASVEQSDIDEGALYPALSKLRAITGRIAVSVALEAAAAGVAEPLDEAEAARRAEETMWQPDYPELIPA